MASWFGRSRSAPPQTAAVPVQGPLTCDVPSPAEEAMLLAQRAPAHDVDEAAAAYMQVVRTLLARRNRQCWNVPAPDPLLPPAHGRATTPETPCVEAGLGHARNFGRDGHLTPSSPPLGSLAGAGFFGELVLSQPDAARLASTQACLPDRAMDPLRLPSAGSDLPTITLSPPAAHTAAATEATWAEASQVLFAPTAEPLSAGPLPADASGLPQGQAEASLPLRALQPPPLPSGPRPPMPVSSPPQEPIVATSPSSPVTPAAASASASSRARGVAAAPTAPTALSSATSRTSSGSSAGHDASDASATPPPWTWNQFLAHQQRIAAHDLRVAMQHARSAPVPPQIQQIVGGIAAWEQAPVLQLPAHCFGDDPLHQLMVRDVTAPVMRGEHRGRAFVTVRFTETHQGAQGIVTLAQVEAGQVGTQDWLVINPHRFGPSALDAHNFEPRLLGLRYQQPNRLPPARDARDMMQALRRLVVEGRYSGRGHYVLFGQAPGRPAEALGALPPRDVGAADPNAVNGLDGAEASTPDATTAGTSGSPTPPATRTPEAPGPGHTEVDGPAGAPGAWSTQVSPATTPRLGLEARQLGEDPTSVQGASGAREAGPLPTPPAVPLDAFSWVADGSGYGAGPDRDVPSDFSASSDGEGRTPSHHEAAFSRLVRAQPDVDSGDESSLSSFGEGRPSQGNGRAPAERGALRARPAERGAAALPAQARRPAAGPTPSRPGAVAPEPVLGYASRLPRRQPTGEAARFGARNIAASQAEASPAAGARTVPAARFQQAAGTALARAQRSPPVPRQLAHEPADGREARGSTRAGPGGGTREPKGRSRQGGTTRPR